MKPLPPRLEREFETIRHMIELYCRRHHGAAGGYGVCDDCAGLMAYARKRLEHCPFQEEKPACLKCPIHCYSPRRREETRKVMRYSGPRMMWHHPVLALLHQLDGWKAVPEIPPGRRPAGGKAQSDDVDGETPDGERKKRGGERNETTDR